LTIGLLIFYLVSHAVGFAGIGTIVFLCVYEKDVRDVHYLAFLASFFLYVALSNAAFFRSTFMGKPDYFTEVWYFAAYTAVSSVLMIAYSAMFHALPKTPQSARHLRKLVAFSCVPLAFLATGLLSLSRGDSIAIRIFLMRATAFALASLLAYSIFFMARNLKNAIDAECYAMMRFTIAANSVFIIPFLAENWYNYDVSHPWIPLCAENAYYLALNLANIGMLATGVLLKRKKKIAEEISGRAAYTLAALGEKSLNDRERNILAFLLIGLGNKQIAAHLEITEFMVRNQISALLKRSGARNRVELVDLYRRTLAK